VEVSRLLCVTVSRREGRRWLIMDGVDEGAYAWMTLNYWKIGKRLRELWLRIDPAAALCSRPCGYDPAQKESAPPAMPRLNAAAFAVSSRLGAPCLAAPPLPPKHTREKGCRDHWSACDQHAGVEPSWFSKAHLPCRL
jgi:hypothetical protein